MFVPTVAGRRFLTNQLRKLPQFTRMLTSHAVIFSSHGEPKDVLKTHTYEIDENNIKPNEIVLKTLGAPVNPSDINQVQGVYPSQPEKTTQLGTSEPSAVGGNEGLFEIIKIGSDVKGFQVGDWAIPTSVNFGTWRSHALCEEGKMMKVPNPEQSKQAGKKQGLTINQGATLSVNPLTAYLMLTHYVKLTPGKDWFIQNGGNSAVGKFASQIGKLLGIHSISVVRDRPEIEELKKELKEVCGATQVITEEQNNSKDFGPQVKQWVKETGGEIKLALNCVGGKSSAGVARKLAPNGLMLTYGGMSFQPVTLPTSLHIFKNVTSAGFWVTELLKSDPNLKRETVDKIVEWYTSGELLDAPSKENQWGDQDLAQVFIDAVANSKSGKQLVKF
ncbi:hypothetical protein CJJ07_000450 [Candidozyma auris]|nr:hypothetical protein CJJ07_000450 [[Candida] auris]